MVEFRKRNSPASTRERVRRIRFERIVASVLKGLPPHIVAMMDNVHVTTADEPTAEQRAQDPDADSLFGLYEGTPLTQRAGYSLALPDQITIFRRPLEAACATDAELAEEIRITVLHELAHHLGFEEDRIDELGLG
jgi:predicted Zn-dependent protease with MMP-like domain